MIHDYAEVTDGNPKFVIVKAHTRRINGKVVKVRSHYRSGWQQLKSVSIIVSE